MSETIEATDEVAEDSGADSYEHRIKCMACGLHYSVFSYDEDWASQRDGGSCPECGTRGRKMAWGPVTMTADNGGQFIFMRVPGGTADDPHGVPMQGIWVAETRAAFGAARGLTEGNEE